MATCFKCGEENPDHARFCLACATPLAEARTPSEERKVVSVLFVDLVGFTSQSDKADPEDVRARLQPYHARVKQEIERFGGTVEKFVGDAVMAVFGAPVAHEDDAERAVRAGLRVLDAVDELGLQVRAAVNTGEALVALGARAEVGEALVAGDVVNTAARLQQAAPTGALVVGEATQRATRDAILYEPLEPLAVKGKAVPVAAWLAKEARSRFGVDVEQPAAAPLIGREHELRLLQDVFARALREAGAQLVTVTGEPGVGKSRLVSEFRAFVDDQAELVFWRQGRCLPYGEGIAFWALGEVVKAQAGILESDSPEEAADKLDAAVATVVDNQSERDWTRARLAPLVGIRGESGEGGAARTESFTAWRGYLEAIAASRPLVLVFEDLHWADDVMLEFVDHLVEWSSGVPLLVLCTGRPELYERQPGWGGGKRNATTVALSPLSDQETARLIAELLHRAVLPAETQQALLERSGGNPLYAEEFARMLADRGFLAPAGTLSGDIPVPETIQAVIAARLDTLPASSKALMHDAAVVGKVFWAGTVSFIGGQSDSTVAEGLHQLVRKELVRPVRRSSIEGETEYAFWHMLVRDVAYGQIPRAARARKHRAAAEWIERIAGERVQHHAEVVSHHLVRALELSHAAGLVDEVEQHKGRAARFLVLAGEQTLFLDVTKGEAYFRKALEVAPSGSRERVRALTGVTHAAALTGRMSYREIEATYEQAIDELRGLGDPVGAAGVMTLLARTLWHRGEGERSWALLEESIGLLESQPPSRELMVAYLQKASNRLVAGQPQVCFEAATRAYDLAKQLASEVGQARALQWRGIARHDLGDAGGIDDVREALRRNLAAGSALHAFNSHGSLADMTWLLEGAAKGLEAYRTTLDFAVRRGFDRGRDQLWVRAESVWPLYDLGEWDELLRTADEVLGAASDQTAQPQVIALSYKAQVLRQRGMLGDALGLPVHFLPTARQSGDPQVLEPALAVAAAIEDARGNSAAAVQLVDEIHALVRTRLVRSVFLPDALRVCVRAGELRLAESLLGDVRRVSTRPVIAAMTGDAIVAEARDDHARALDLYDDACSRWRDYGNVVEQGQTALGAARCLLALGRQAEAETRLREAQAIFARLLAAPLVAEVDALLGETKAVSS